MKGSFLAALAVLTLPLAGPVFADESSGESQATHEITVYKSPTCGCCKLWIAHLQDHGFTVLAVDSDDMTAVKDAHEVPRTLRSCHTARIGGYTVEGHVPAQDILAMLEAKPNASGLSVPGMPVGSPGMEYGDRVDAYDVVQFDGEQTTVVASYGDQPQPEAEHAHDH